MTFIRSLLDHEPIFWVNLVKAVLMLATVYGVSITADQTTAILEVVGLVVILLIGNKIQHDNVTPVGDPKLPEGTVVEVITPPGEPNRAKTL